MYEGSHAAATVPPRRFTESLRSVPQTQERHEPCTVDVKDRMDTNQTLDSFLFTLKYHQKFKIFRKEKTEYSLAGLAQSGGLSHSLKTRPLILF